MIGKYQNVQCFQCSDDSCQNRTQYKPSSSHFTFIDDTDDTESEEVLVKCEILLKTYRLGCTLLNTIEQIKTKLEQLDRIPSTMQILYFNNIALHNMQTLKEVGVANKDVMHLKVKLHTAYCKSCDNYRAPKTEPVTVTLNTLTGDVYKVDIPLTNPVEDLKNIIEEKYSLHPNQMLIVYDDKKLEDDISLGEYGLDETTELLLVLYQYDRCSFCSACAISRGCPTATIEFLNTSVQWVLLDQMSTVREFKETTYIYLHHIHPDMQKLMYKNQELKDENTLESYGVGDGSILNIKLYFNKRKCDECGLCLN